MSDDSCTEACFYSFLRLLGYLRVVPAYTPQRLEEKREAGIKECNQFQLRLTSHIDVLTKKHRQDEDELRAFARPRAAFDTRGHRHWINPADGGYFHRMEQIMEADNQIREAFIQQRNEVRDRVEASQLETLGNEMAQKVLALDRVEMIMGRRDKKLIEYRAKRERKERKDLEKQQEELKKQQEKLKQELERQPKQMDALAEVDYLKREVEATRDILHEQRKQARTSVLHGNAMASTVYGNQLLDEIFGSSGAPTGDGGGDGGEGDDGGGGDEGVRSDDVVELPSDSVELAV